jgi:hypothetical protein
MTKYKHLLLDNPKIVPVRIEHVVCGRNGIDYIVHPYYFNYIHNHRVLNYSIRVNIYEYFNNKRDSIFNKNVCIVTGITIK